MQTVGCAILRVIDLFCRLSDSMKRSPTKDVRHDPKAVATPYVSTRRTEVDVKNLDAILDDALDDFEEQEMQDKITQMGDKNDEMAADAEAERIHDMEKMQDMMAQLNDPQFGHVLQSTLKSLSTTSEGIENVDNLFAQLAKQFETNTKSNIVPTKLNDAAGIERADREVAGTLQMLGAAQQGMEGFEVSKFEDVGETMINDMMAQFEALGEKEDYNEAIDGVMRQLLSRELMYDPIKQVCDKFPEWLALNRPNLSESEYNNYGHQYQTFQRLLAVYDAEPDNFPRLVTN